MGNKTEVVLCIVLNDDGEVLIIERSKKEKGGANSMLLWSFPGGTVEINETRVNALKRELVEETGYLVEPVDVISEKDHPQFPVHVIYFRCRLLNNQTVGASDPDISSVKWVSPSLIKTYFTTTLDERVAKHLGI